MKKKNLIIIAGRSDWVWPYAIITPVWRLFGYNPHLMAFGWSGPHTSFEYALSDFVKRVKDRGEPVDVIGIDMGGVAAVHALIRRPDLVRRVITIATPYRVAEKRSMSMAYTAVYSLASDLVATRSVIKSRILSIHGRYDELVPIWTSQPRDIVSYGILSFFHGATIACALTVHGRIIRRFLATGKHQTTKGSTP